MFFSITFFYRKYNARTDLHSGLTSNRFKCFNTKRLT